LAAGLPPLGGAAVEAGPSTAAARKSPTPPAAAGRGRRRQQQVGEETGRRGTGRRAPELHGSVHDGGRRAEGGAGEWGSRVSEREGAAAWIEWGCVGWPASTPVSGEVGWMGGERVEGRRRDLDGSREMA
jgi:hypothetical protein